VDPVLFLNSSFEHLDGLLGSQRGRPAHQRALHDQVRSAIASEVWTLLCLDAIAASEVNDDGEVSWPQEDWRRTTLTAMLPGLYGAADDEALRRAKVAITEGETIGELLERTLPGALSQARASRLLRNALRGIGTLDQDEEEDESQ
jgi:hypothetical protein